MYAYCENNPVMRSDPSGESFEFLKEIVKAFSTEFVKPALTTIKDYLYEIDLTYSHGFSLYGTFGIFPFFVDLGISYDTKGNVAVQVSYGSGFTTGTPGAEVHVGMSQTHTIPQFKFNIFTWLEEVYHKIEEW